MTVTQHMMTPGSNTMEENQLILDAMKDCMDLLDELKSRCTLACIRGNVCKDRLRCAALKDYFQELFCQLHQGAGLTGLRKEDPSSFKKGLTNVAPF